MAGTPGRMVRKQLNIEVGQDAALKRLATERGVSESEIVREAIARLMSDLDSEQARRDRVGAALDQLFAEWDESPFEAPDHSAYRLGIYDER